MYGKKVLPVAIIWANLRKKCCSFDSFQEKSSILFITCNVVWGIRKNHLCNAKETLCDELMTMMLILYQHTANEWIDVKSLSHKQDAVSYLGYKILQIASFVSLSSHSLIKRCRKSSPLSTLLGRIIKDVYLLMKFSNCEKYRFLFHFMKSIEPCILYPVASMELFCL